MNGEENRKRHNENAGRYVRLVVEGTRGTLGHAIVEHDHLEYLFEPDGRFKSSACRVISMWRKASLKCAIVPRTRKRRKSTRFSRPVPGSASVGSNVFGCPRRHF